jgi:hypothetical protein
MGFLPRRLKKCHRRLCKLTDKTLDYSTKRPFGFNANGKKRVACSGGSFSLSAVVSKSRSIPHGVTSCRKRRIGPKKIE